MDVCRIMYSKCGKLLKYLSFNATVFHVFCLFSCLSVCLVGSWNQHTKGSSVSQRTNWVFCGGGGRRFAEAVCILVSPLLNSTPWYSRVLSLSFLLKYNFCNSRLWLKMSQNWFWPSFERTPTFQGNISWVAWCYWSVDMAVRTVQSGFF